MSINDNVDYSKLSILSQGWEKILFNFNSNYKAETVTVAHNLGYVPNVLAYWDVASGDRDPDSITASEFNGNPLPYIQYQNGFGLGAPTIYRYVYFNVDNETLTFTVQQWGTSDATTDSHFFKYYLFSQTALQ